MICCDFLTDPGGAVLGFLLKGHANAGDYGKDIVCAAVSSAAYLTANTLTDVLQVVPDSLRVREGEMFLQLSPKDEPRCRDLLSGLRLHLMALEEQYPDSLRVGYRNICF